MMLEDIAKCLKAAGIADPRREARSLIMAVTGVDPFLSSLNLSSPHKRGSQHVLEEIPDQVGDENSLEIAIQKRIARMPLSKIIGTKDFYGREFITSKDVLDPRPDSETIIEQALKFCPDNARILDLGTGSGCLIVTMLAEKPDATGVAVDISAQALDIARQNAEKLGVSDRVQFVEESFESYLNEDCHPCEGRDPRQKTSALMDVDTRLRGHDNKEEKFNLLLSNPPYIPSAEIDTLEPEVKDHDPRLALDGGTDGCDPYRLILQRMSEFLLPNSHFILEFSPDICEKVFRLAVQAGHTDVEIIRDLAGRERVLLGRCE